VGAWIYSIVKFYLGFFSLRQDSTIFLIGFIFKNKNGINFLKG